MEIQNRDIFTVKRGIICHQVNAQGVMGAGIAAQIKSKYPKVYEDYISIYKKEGLQLGTAIVTEVEFGKLFIASLVAQKEYGRGRNFTNYQALTIAIRKIEKFRKSIDKDFPIFFPYKMSCGLAGGNWNIVEDIIDMEAPSAIICKL